MAKQKKPVIDITDDDFGMVINCAIRYSLGRQTYMPHSIMDYTRPLLPYLTKRTLVCIERDIKDRELFEYGLGHDTIDKPAWLKFLNEVHTELHRRESEQCQTNT